MRGIRYTHAGTHAKRRLIPKKTLTKGLCGTKTLPRKNIRNVRLRFYLRKSQIFAEISYMSESVSIYEDYKMSPEIPRGPLARYIYAYLCLFK